ncbi:aminotransferase class V-fold PLP-dependent enzyme [Nocardia terpenica]|uniref:aminotransferase class V-fold PLP-dependent enzyme n=1 Tax=Nocardia terpenica TaxID=455432 RepID=UPI000318DA02|nr:aminotransferase class V-fold PLP-dependent enzyme [Nocardia terpenica]
MYDSVTRFPGPDYTDIARISDLDLRMIRDDTPGTECVIHLNNAGAALMPRPVIDTMREHITLESQIGAYEAAEAMEGEIRASYTSIAQLLGCSANEIAITDSATRAWGLAFGSIQFHPGDRILASPVEYGSNYLALLHSVRHLGIEVEILRVTESSIIDTAALRETMDERVRAILVTHVPSHSGVINPIAEIGEVARKYGSLYMVDACQSVGQIPISVSEIACDFLSGCGRKYLRGPRGTGFLYMRPDISHEIEPPMLGLDGARWLGGTRYEIAPGAKRFETWEANTVAKLGLGAAVDYSLTLGIHAIRERVTTLADYLRRCLTSVSDVHLLDQYNADGLAGIVGFDVPGRNLYEIRNQLKKKRINVWISLSNTACVDMERRKLNECIRVSVHYYNTIEEIDTFCNSLLDSIDGRV